MTDTPALTEAQWNSDMDAAPRDGTFVDLWVQYRDGAARVADCRFDKAHGYWVKPNRLVAVAYDTSVPLATHFMYPPEPPEPEA